MRSTNENGRNFVKAFTVFGVDHDINNTAVITMKHMMYSLLNYLTYILYYLTSNTYMNDDDYNNIHLPPHFRCASHTLDLVVSKDIETYFNDTKHTNKLDFIQLKKL